jgi:hypothetical protein
VDGAAVLILFQPLIVGSTSLPVLEVMVVLIDVAVVKLVVALNPFPGDGYLGAGRVANRQPHHRQVRLIAPGSAAGASCLHRLHGRAYWRLNQWRQSLS